MEKFIESVLKAVEDYTTNMFGETDGDYMEAYQIYLKEDLEKAFIKLEEELDS